MNVRPGKRGLRMAALPIAGVVAAVALWWLATAIFNIRTLFLPSPPQIVEAFREFPGYLLAQAGTTLVETLGGFAIATVVGLLTAALLAASPTVERATLPLVIGLHAIPKVALAPLLVMWMGYGTAPKLTLAALICYFPIVIAALAGLTSTPAELGELVRSLSASRWQAFVKVRVPYAVPQIFIGLKLGMSLAVIGTVVAQITTPNGGLGAAIVMASASFNIPLVFAAIALLMVISIGLFYAVVIVEKVVAPWARETTAARV